MIQFFTWQPGFSNVQETLHYIEQQLEHHRTRTFQEEYLALLKKTRALSTKNTLGLGAPDHTIPCGTIPFQGTLSQALRARLRSVCPTGHACTRHGQDPQQHMDCVNELRLRLAHRAEST